MAETGKYYLGLDLGSTTAKAAIVRSDGSVVATQYRRHNGRPLLVAAALVREALAGPCGQCLAGACATGSAGRTLAQRLGVPMVNEVVALGVAMQYLYPHVRTALEVGGQDAKVIELNAPGEAGQGNGHGAGFRSFSMNSECAAGTGSFLDQQANRLGVRIEGEFGELAIRCEKPPRVAGRCSVFAKSDMIHLQQQAVPDCDIIAGLCFGMARNFKAGLTRGQELATPVAFVGGVASNGGMVRAFREVFELSGDDLIVPEHHDMLPAIGAALRLITSPDLETTSFNPDADMLARLAEGHETPATRLAPLVPPDGYMPSELFAPTAVDEPISVYLGVDVGSISTNLVLLDDQGRLIDKIYIMTAGRPIEAVRSGLKTLGDRWSGRVAVSGVAATGSGRYLTGDIIGADVVRNEITAQARGAAHVAPDVDTIFEIGGQDSKYIRLRDGVVVDFEMNHVCAAGTGSFLEEQAERLGISIKDEFARLALASRGPLRLGERCTVFMESDLVHHQQQGAALEDLVAGLSYSIAANYLNRVVGTRSIGSRILFQGGTAFNRAVTAAFAAITGRPIAVPPHHEVTGAIGAALLARDVHREGSFLESAFRGFAVSDQPYDVRTFTCKACPNFCDIREVRMADRPPLYYGSRCDRYNKKNEGSDGRDGWPDLFAERERRLLGLPPDAEETSRRCPVRSKSVGGDKTSRGVVGIPRALTFHQLLPFWRTLLERMGYEVLVSPTTDSSIVRSGVESVLSQVCFPVKVAHGHVRWLVDHGVDYLLLPSVLALPRDHDSQQYNHLCPYVQSLPYQVESALGLRASGVTVLTPVLDFEPGYDATMTGLRDWVEEMEIPSQDALAAIAAATRAQKDFEEACVGLGRKTLDHLPDGATPAVVISRPYNGCDAGVNMDLARRMRQVGLLAIPMDFLDLRGFDLGEDWENLFWKYGQKIIRAAEVVRESPDMQAVYLSNFGCGPDSFLKRFFQEALGANRPLLAIEIDEHSAPAGLVTRLEAFADSLGGSDRRAEPSRGHIFRRHGALEGRTLLVPHMCDHAYAFAAAFRGAGLKAEVIPPSDDESLALGRQATSGRECLPCIVTAGDMLRELRRPGVDPHSVAFFMPSGTGPCRFGMYNKLHQLILRDAGYPDVPVVSPNQGASFYEDFRRLPRDPTRGAWRGIVAVDALVRALHATRPYETTVGETDVAYTLCLRAVEKALELNLDLWETMVWCAQQFRDVLRDSAVSPKPRVGVVGEIYVRSQSFSNQDMVRRLESLGLEVDLAGFAEWIYYTNWTRLRRTRSRRQWKLWLGTVIKQWVQRRDEVRAKRPFDGLFGELFEPETEEVVALGRDYIDDTFEGEAILSVGKAVQMARTNGAPHHRPVAGVVNLMPFTCMPGNIVAAVLSRMQRDLGELPILSVACDGQRDASLDIRCEAFAEQVKAFDASRTS